MDVLCVHNELRVLLIAQFLRDGPIPQNSVAKAYEDLCEAWRGMLALENIAMVWTTAMISLMVLALCLPGAWGMFVPQADAPSLAQKWYIGGYSVVGFILSGSAALFRERKRRELSVRGGLQPKPPRQYAH